MERNPVDRSLAFTALLEWNWFRQATSRDGEQHITRFLEDYYGQESIRNIWDFAQDWGNPETGVGVGSWEWRPPR